MTWLVHKKTKALTVTWGLMEGSIPLWLPQVFQESREITQRLPLHTDQRNSSLMSDQYCGVTSCLNHGEMGQFIKELCVYECVFVEQNTLARGLGD